MQEKQGAKGLGFAGMETPPTMEKTEQGARDAQEAHRHGHDHAHDHAHSTGHADAACGGGCEHDHAHGAGHRQQCHGHEHSHRESRKEVGMNGMGGMNGMNGTGGMGVEYKQPSLSAKPARPKPDEANVEVEARTSHRARAALYSCN